MKMQITSSETKETIVIEIPNPCSFQQLTELVSQKLPSTSMSSIYISPQESVRSTQVPDSDKQNETLNVIVSGNNPSSKESKESMEIDNGGSTSISEARKSFSVPDHLMKVLTDKLGDYDGRNLKLLWVAVHAVLLESGFVEIDPVSKLLKNNNTFNVKDNWDLASFYYTLPNIITGGGNIELVKVKFQNLGRYCEVYASLFKGTVPHSMRLDADRLVRSLNTVWAKCGPVVANIGKYNKIFDVESEVEVLEFWREVKDKISLPLLIDLCEKAGLQAPPCFMRLPAEIKLKILEMVSGEEVAKMSCVCTELRCLASSDDLWEQKYIEQFEDSINSFMDFRQTKFKDKFVWATTDSWFYNFFGP